MNVSRVFLQFAFGSVLAASGCGGEGKSSSDGDCTGTELSDEQLCSLTCGETTLEEAKTLLGPPDVSSGTLLSYSYTCTDGTEAEGVNWYLNFSEDVLDDVSRIGLGSFAAGSLPECIEDCHL